jgi:hypothetical protein
MDSVQITKGGERKRLLLFGSMLFGFVAAVNATYYAIGKLLGRSPDLGFEDSLALLGSCALISGILLNVPAFLTMVIVKRFRCVQYVAAIAAGALASAGILGLVFYWFDMLPGPFPWRSHRFADTLTGAVMGFDLGLLGGSCLAPFALLVLPRPRALPQDFGDGPGE